MAKRFPHNWTEIRRDWPALSASERFEAFVALVLTLIVTDLSAIPPAAMGAEAALILALGVTYWLMRDRDDRLRASRPRAAS